MKLRDLVVGAFTDITEEEKRELLDLIDGNNYWHFDGYTRVVKDKMVVDVYKNKARRIQ